MFSRQQAGPACGGVRSRWTTPRCRAPSAAARGRDGAVRTTRAPGHGLRRALAAWAICVRARETAFVRCAAAAREPSVDLRLRTFPTASAGSQAWPGVSSPSDHPRAGARRRSSPPRQRAHIHSTVSEEELCSHTTTAITDDGAAAAPDVRSVRVRHGRPRHKLRVQCRGLCVLAPATSCEGDGRRCCQADRGRAAVLRHRPELCMCSHG